MSLAKLNAKEAKGKRKLLPKLKAILASPNKRRCPTLDEQEMQHLKCLIQNAIQESKLEPKRFATEKGICLGLESSLRHINNQTSSGVFISLSIKPNYLIGLIAKNAETKNETQPVYAQPKLETFIEEIFGIQALCMVFSKASSAISKEINKWLEERQNIPKIKMVQVIEKKPKKNIKKLKMEKPYVTALKKDGVKSENMAKEWCSDFISFGNDICGLDNTKLEDNRAVDALTKIIDNIPITTKAITRATHKTEAIEVDNDMIAPPTISYSVSEGDENSHDSDHFLNKYKTLTVHKIKGNPNKNPKKKRKKNKKKNPAK